MSAPIAPANSIPPPSPQNDVQAAPGEFDRALAVKAQTVAPATPRSARDAPTTPGRRLPVIDKRKVDPEILKAAQGMEALFLNDMMKSMRHTIPKNEMDLDGPATDIYRGMLDSEYADKAAKQGGIGLADQIVAYLYAQQYNHESPGGLLKAPPAPTSPPGNGGDDPTRKLAEQAPTSYRR